MGTLPAAAAGPCAPWDAPAAAAAGGAEEPLERRQPAASGWCLSGLRGGTCAPWRAPLAKAKALPKPSPSTGIAPGCGGVFGMERKLAPPWATWTAPDNPPT